MTYVLKAFFIENPILL